jgi:hypothetical protein
LPAPLDAGPRSLLVLEAFAELWIAAQHHRIGGDHARERIRLRSRSMMQKRAKA